MTFPSKHISLTCRLPSDPFYFRPLSSKSMYQSGYHQSSPRFKLPKRPKLLTGKKGLFLLSATDFQLEEMSNRLREKYVGRAFSFFVKRKNRVDTQMAFISPHVILEAIFELAEYNNEHLLVNLSSEKSPRCISPWEGIWFRGFRVSIARQKSLPQRAGGVSIRDTRTV